jgi:sulfatase modifying factor 1
MKSKLDQAPLIERFFTVTICFCRTGNVPKRRLFMIYRFVRNLVMMEVLVNIFCLAVFAGAPDIEMIHVKGGCFQMGDVFGDGFDWEKPVHEVCVDDFYIGKYEVTQRQWMAVMGNNPSIFKYCGDDCPVENVSWDDVQDFINKLNEMTGGKYRLPTEAEWEYAARSGGKNEKYAGTSEPAELEDYAWFEDNSGKKTHPVGKKKPNGLGIYDMSGNVWEWVKDHFNDKYYEKSPHKNPRGAETGSGRVDRGGGWGSDLRHVRTVYRGNDTSDVKGSGIGFRLSKSP